MLKLLIDAGANLSWPASALNNLMFDGCLSRIIENADDELLEYALQNGAKPNASSCYGDSCTYPLAEAVKKNNMDAVRILLKHGCDVNYQDPYKANALMIAMKNNNSKLVDLLLQYGADIYKEGNDGTTLETKTPLEYAKTINNREILALVSKYRK